MRPIDADALIDAINKWIPEDPKELMESAIPPLENMAVSVLMTISEQPTIDAVPRWIPVTERLPRERLLILISCAVPYDDRYDHVTAGCYLNGTWLEMDGFRILKDVHAWMPLPKPYKAIPPVAEGSK